MKPKFRSLIAAFAPLQRSSLIVCASLCAATAAHAADQSWTGATSGFWNDDTNWSTLAPIADDVAIFNGGANLATTLGADFSIQGLTVGSGLSGPVSVAAGNTLTIGASGIDMSAATQDLTLGCAVTVAGNSAQEWSVISGRALTVSGVLAGGSGVVSFDTTAGGTINVAGTVNDLLGRFATINQADFSGLDASNNVVAGKTLSGLGLVTYADNPNTGASLPNIGAGPWDLIDVVNSNTSSPSAFRLASSTVPCYRGVRLNTPHATGLNWTMDNASSRNFSFLPGAGIFVGSSVNTDVVWGGSGTIRTYGSGQHDLYLTNHSANNLIFNCGFSAVAGRSWRLVKSGTGKVIFAGTATAVSAGLYIDQGTVQIGNGGTTGAVDGGGTYSVAAGASLAWNRTDAVNLANAINGAGSVTIAGTGSLTLSGTNSYTGPTNLNAGNLVLTNLDDIGGSTDLNFNGGTLQWSGINDDISLLTVTFGAGGAGLDTNGNDVAIADPIGNAGSGGLTKKGAGTLTLQAANDYSGDTSIVAGTLLANNPSGSATGSGNATVSGTGVLGGTGSISGTVTVSPGGSVAPGDAGIGDITVGGLDLAAGAVLDFEFGTGNDGITVSNTDGLTINGGTVNLYDDGTTNPFSTLGEYTLMTFSGTVQGAGASSLVVGNPVLGLDYSFSVVGNALKLTIAPGGLVTHWTGTADANWSDSGSWDGTIPGVATDSAVFNTDLVGGPVTVTLDSSIIVGGLLFESASNSYTLAPSATETLTFDNDLDPSTLIVNAGEHFISAPVTLTSDLAVSTLADTDKITLSGDLDGAGSLTMNGLGTLVLSGTNTATGGIFLADGTIEFSSGSLGSNDLTFTGGRLRWAGHTLDISSLTVSVNSGGAVLDTNSNDVSFANAIGNGGSGLLTKAGAGDLTFAVDNSYGGGTRLLQGSLTIAGDGGLGPVPGAPATNITFDAGTGNSATLRLSAPITLGTNRTISAASGTGFIDTNGNDMTIPGSITGSGVFGKTGAGTLTIQSDNHLSATGGITINEGTVSVGTQNNLPAGTITLNGTGGIFNGNAAASYTNVVVNGTNSLTKTYVGNILGLGTTTGNGTLTFGGPYVNDFTGSLADFTGTIIANAGGFRFNGTTGGTNLTLDLAGHGATVRNGATTITLGQLAGIAGSNLSGSGGGATQAVTYVIGGKTEDGLGLTPVDSTYDGAITNGANTVSVTKTGASTLTLGGLNTYTGNTSVQGGGLVLADGGQLTFKIGAFGTNTMISAVNGDETLALDGAFNIDVSGAAIEDGNYWILVDPGFFADIAVGATFSVVGYTDEGGGIWTKVEGGNTWTFDTSSGELSLAVVPGYAGWASANAGGQTADGDFDLDGVSNGVEYFMNAAAGFTANPGLVGGTVAWTNGGNIDSGAYGTEFVVQTSADLNTWTDVLVSDPNLDNQAGSVSYTPTATAPFFVRLMVTPN